MGHSFTGSERPNQLIWGWSHKNEFNSRKLLENQAIKSEVEQLWQDQQDNNRVSCTESSAEAKPRGRQVLANSVDSETMLDRTRATRNLQNLRCKSFQFRESAAATMLAASEVARHAMRSSIILTPTARTGQSRSACRLNETGISRPDHEGAIA